jgi:ectonucleotide pyrophosphatase/phosphodiesterase family protein 4
MSDIHCGGAHGYDNAAPEMRAVFLARGPLFRSDGARLVGELGYESSEAEALVGDAAVTAGGSVHAGTTADAERWQQRTLAFENVIVHSIVAAGLGLDLDPASVMPDGAPPPRVDGVLDEELANLLFRDGVGVRSGPGGDDGAKKGALTPDEDDDDERGGGRGGDGTAAWVVAVGVVAIVVGAIVVGARGYGYVRRGDANSAYVKLGSVFEPGGVDAEAEIEMPEVRVERESTPAVFASLTEGDDGEGEDAGGGTFAGTSRKLREGDENA